MYLARCSGHEALSFASVYTSRIIKWVIFDAKRSYNYPFLFPRARHFLRFAPILVNAV